MRAKLLVIALAVSALCIFQAQAQTADSGFPKGELSPTKNHTGNIWLSELNIGDSTFDPSIAMATYDAGAKLDWHVHPAVKFCSLQALAITRNGESRYEPFTREIQSNALQEWSIGTAHHREAASPI
jgi:hypothetical protein